MTTAFAYAQPRLQARHARRPLRATWQRLRASTTLAHFLEQARKTELDDWIGPLHAGLEVTEIERTLRRAFDERVREVASWVPHAWQPATLWFGKLPELASVAALLGELEHPAWLRLEPASDELAALAWDELARALEDCELEPLTRISLGAEVRQRWSKELRSRWPRMLPSARRGLTELGEAAARYLHASLDPNRDGWQLQDDLEDAVTRSFRRHSEQPAAVFCHLCLLGIDVARLRGALARRALFPGVESEAQWA